MKTGETTFRSEDEYWAWLEKQARRRDRLIRVARYLALMGAFALVMFLFMYFCVRRMGTGRYDQWSEALHSVRAQSG